MNDEAKNKVNLAVLLFIPALFICLLIITIVMESNGVLYVSVNIPLHSSIEAIGAVASLFVSILLIMERNRWGFDSLGLAFGFFAMGYFDILHSILSSGQSFVLTHTMAVLFGGLGFLITFVINKFEVNKKAKDIFIYSLFAFAVAIGIISMFFTDMIPNMIVASEFTTISKVINFFAGTCYLVGVIFFLQIYLKKRNGIIYLLFSITLLLGVSSLTFAYSEIWFGTWWLWHITRMIAFLLIIIFVLFENNRNFKAVSKMNIEIGDINNKLNSYTYTISHDLKEPIRSIRTFSEFILEDNEENFNETDKDYFNRIVRASQKMADMVDDLLILSRVGRVSIEFENVLLRDLMVEVEESLAASILESNAKITYKRLPRIYCQPLWIKMVLSNLLSNSIKYKNQDIDGIEIQITYKDKGDFFEFSVIDNGKGIASEQYEKIFGLFRKAHTDRNIEGSGAGLAIVAAIIEQHGGKIWIKSSEIGMGTNITFSINKKGERLWQTQF